jgi:GAF domain-containing protein
VEEEERARSGRILEETLSSVTDLLEMDVAFVSEFVEDRLVFRALKGDAPSFGWEEGGSIPLEESYCKRVIDGRLPSAVPDATGDERTRDLRITREAGIGSYVGVPLKLSDGRPYGTLCCLSHSPDPWLAERDVRLMEGLARETVSRLEREGLL